MSFMDDGKNHYMGNPLSGYQPQGEKTPNQAPIIKPIKACEYLLPCGICNRTNQMCSQYMDG